MPIAVKALSFPASLPLAGAALLLGLFVYFDVVIYRDYVPRGDEPAFIGATLESPASWFTRGYLNYFDVYPEWGTPHTSPLLRPVTNAVGYLNYSLFGSTYALHFAMFFAMQFVGLLIFVRLLRDLAVPPLPAAGMSLLFLFNPAFMSPGLFCLPCHFDVLSGVFALAAFLTSWRKRYGMALALLILAVFTKESAVYTPLAAALSLLIWRRPPVMTALLLLPLPLWALARFLAFGDVLDAGIASPSWQIPTGLSIWPTGLASLDFLLRLGSSFPSSGPEIVSEVFFLTNLGLWPFLCYAAFAAARRHVDAPGRAELTTGLLVWTMGALSFGVLAGFHHRFGGSIYPFLYLFLAALFFSPGYRVPRWAVASVLLVFSAATFVQSARSVRLALVGPSLVAPERALYDALRRLPQDGRTVYVVNAPRGLASAPRYIRRAWSLDLDLVVVNQFRECATSPDAGSARFLGSADVLVRVPDCATLEFGIATPDILSGATVKREGIGAYRLVGDVAVGSVDPPQTGPAFTLQFESTPADLTLIGYDWARGSYDAIDRP